jgi:very-short-patch-repair endonuclease
LKIVIEIDGSQHGEPEGLARDAERTAYLKSRGYQVLRFWNTDVLRETDSVMESVFAAIVQTTGTPHP